MEMPINLCRYVNLCIHKSTIINGRVPYLYGLAFSKISFSSTISASLNFISFNPSPRYTKWPPFWQTTFWNAFPWMKIPIQIALKFILRNPVNNKIVLVQVMAWCRLRDKPLPEPMVTQFTYAYMRHWGRGVCVINRCMNCEHKSGRNSLTTRHQAISDPPHSNWRRSDGLCYLGWCPVSIYCMLFTNHIPNHTSWCRGESLCPIIN